MNWRRECGQGFGEESQDPVTLSESEKLKQSGRQTLNYLSNHGWHVPYIANNGPAGHDPQQVADNVVFAAIPERISKLRIIL